ncbi:MAG TPA: 50S ribosomal protein L11 methyltransferase [Balneolales bacterium]|nr:50S ribosomal protein L11 methyltransferase [Balneolales bacterium]
MDYLKLEIIIPSDYQESLIAELFEMDFEGFEQYDDRILAYIPQNRFSDVYREEIEQWLSSLREHCYIEKEEIEETRNYNEEWEQSIQQQSIGNFFVRPTWLPGNAPEGMILLEIDPKMAFGTGYHETTRLMLRAIPKFVKKGDRVLDVGTGTGILSIAAVKIGAHSSLGFDIDEWSYDNANENIMINNVKDRVIIIKGSFDVINADSRYDVILANVNRTAILSMDKELVGHLNKEGTLLLSGLLEQERNIILQNEYFKKLKLVHEDQEGEWIVLIFKNS